MNIRTMVAIAALFALSACMAAPLTPPPIDTGDLPGFWSGTWHGSITGIAFIVSFFRDDVAIYAAQNSGAWYDLGFLFGINILATAIKVFWRALSSLS